jgi:predicted outer membrane repeat protein
MTRIIKCTTPLALFILNFIFDLQAAIITVKQDGTGDYTTIEAGMNESVWNIGDTVLVWPGTYYEHISYNGNHITVASLYAINFDPWYISNTIIDGSQSGQCVTMNWGENDLIINGFTIRNGKGNDGGGIYLEEASGVVRNCIIENNTASLGGGVYTEHGHIYLSGTTIRYNHARGSGGGIYCGYESYINFDPGNKCNIYLNFGATGTDYSKFYSVPPQVIIVDTFTVINPDHFFIFSGDGEGFPTNDVAIQQDHAYLEPVDHDLYVNPVSGDDGNSGISINDPLKTIAYAYILIKSDSLNPHKIFLSNGTYSPSTNNEKLAFSTRSYISLIGESMNSTIIDADSLSYFIAGVGVIKNYSIKDITFQHGKGGIHIRHNNHVTISDVTLKSGTASSMGFEIYDTDSLIVKNTIVKNNKGGFAFSICNWEHGTKSFSLENCIITYNVPGTNLYAMQGGGIEIYGNPDIVFSGFGKISNLQITDNIRQPDPEFGMGMTVGLFIYGHYKIDLINATIANNILYGNYGFGSSSGPGVELNIYNSILFGDSLRELSLGYPNSYSYPSTCQVYNSDIEGGQSQVMNWSNINTLVWSQGNLDNDPLWYAIPYALPWNSPCVNAGTPMYEPGMLPPYIIEEETVYKLITFDFDTIVLPQTDLAGNQRIFDGRIDMGAYECQDTTTGTHEFEVRSSRFEVTVYPNPFYANTFISFDLKEQAEVQVLIYDMNGNEVKKLMDASLSAGQYNMTWGGDDDSGQKVGKGTYLVTLFLNGKNLAAEKIVKNVKE